MRWHSSATTFDSPVRAATKTQVSVGSETKCQERNGCFPFGFPKNLLMGKCTRQPAGLLPKGLFKVFSIRKQLPLNAGKDANLCRSSSEACGSCSSQVNKTSLQAARVFGRCAHSGNLPGRWHREQRQTTRRPNGVPT